MNSISPCDVDNIAWSYISESAQKKHNTGSRNLTQFIQQISHIYTTDKKDERTNIIDQGERKTYALPSKELYELFTILEECRLEGSIMHFSERQLDPCGFMLDFDLIVSNKQLELTDKLLSRLTNILFNELKKDIIFDNTIQYVFYTVRQCKDELNKNEYKYGFHILLPGILLDKAYKKIFLHKFKSNAALLSILQSLSVINVNECVDQNSASVPVLFLGSCKLGSNPYMLNYAYEITVEYDGCLFTKNIDIKDLSEYNLVAELNLTVEAHYDTKEALIRKKRYSYKQDIINQINESSNIHDNEVILIDNSLSILTVHDPEARYLHAILDILPAEYYTERNKWRNVIYALSNKSKSYKPLAIWFSQKCIEKWKNNGMYELDKLWNENTTGSPLTIASISYWAKISNPDKYQTVMNRSYFTTLTEYVYNNLGILEHYMIAKVLHSMFCNKFVTDIDSSSGSKKLTWFEFVLPDQPMIPGELWKWRREPEPVTLQLYISEKLPNVIDLVITHINEQIEKATTESRALFFKEILKRIKTSKSKLFNNKFKCDSITQATYLFHRRGFVEQLDMISDLFGVGNGVLKLGKKCELIDYYHEYPISKFTRINWIPFDENNAKTRMVLNAISDIIVEPDVRDWILFHAAQGLSRDTKEGLLLLFEGGGQNGKTSLLRWISKALGPYADKFNIQLLSCDREEADRPNSAMMKFKYINWAYAEESVKAQSLNVARMKELVNAGEVSSRDLNAKQETFTMKCNFVVASQYSFIVNTTDHGTWRRLRHYTSKVKFCANPDPNNKYEKKDNQDFNLKYSADPEFLSSMLSILTHYYERLQNEYNGLLKNVPCPTLDVETEIFRTSQDSIHRWICECVVISPNNSLEYSLDDITKSYTTWYRIRVEKKDITTNTLHKDIRSSAISKYLRPAPNNSTRLKGCRISETTIMTLQDGEEYISIKESNKEVNQVNPRVCWWQPY